MTASNKQGDHRPYDELSQLEKVTSALHEYGDTMSALAPYKKVTGVTLAGTSFIAGSDRMQAKIDIHSDHQSPWGDNASYVTSFELDETEVAEMASSGPGNFRARFNRIAEEMGEKKTAAVKEARQAMRDALSAPNAAALKTAVSAPRRARFTKKAP